MVTARVSDLLLIKLTDYNFPTCDSDTQEMASAAGGALARQLVQILSKGKTFDRLLEKVRVIDGKLGQVKCEMTVEEEHCNQQGTLHGGMTATLVDNITTLAVMTSNEDGTFEIPGVSVDLNMSYLKAAPLGQTITITADVLKKGRTLVFTKAELFNDKGDILALGHHVKHIGKPKS